MNLYYFNEAYELVCGRLLWTNEPFKKKKSVADSDIGVTLGFTSIQYCVAYQLEHQS
jgi:hypothetical protein